MRQKKIHRVIGFCLELPADCRLRTTVLRSLESANERQPALEAPLERAISLNFNPRPVLSYTAVHRSPIDY